MAANHQSVRTFQNIYEKILYSLPDLIFVFDEKGNFLEFYCEDASTLFLNPKSFFEKNIDDSGLPQNVVELTKTNIKKVLLTKKDSSYQYSLKFELGIKHFEARVFYLEENKVFSIIRDISNIKKSQEIQKELKKHYQDILNRLDHGIVETNSDWAIQYANVAFNEIIGIEKQTVRNKNLFNFLQFSQEKAELFFKKPTKTTKIYVLEAKIETLKKSKDLKISIAKTISQTTNEILYNIDIEDITEEKKKREVLKKNEKTYRNLVESSPNGIIIRDETSILFANKTAINILGFKSLEQARSYKLDDLYLPEYTKQIRERLQNILAEKDISYLEVKKKRPIDGKIIEIETIPARIYYEGKEAFQIVIKDVSMEKNLLETKLRAEIAEEGYRKMRQEIVIRQEMEQELSRSLEEKSLLLKEVHHRVKNNLQIISSLLNLEIRSQKKPDVEQALSRIQSRINSIYLIHEIVYQTDMFSSIDLGHYIKLISENMIRTSVCPEQKFSYSLEDVFVTLDIGVPIGMILNEIFYTYFENVKDYDLHSKLKISLKSQNNTTELRIMYPKRQNSEKNEKEIKTTLSSQLIEALTDQVNGEYKIEKESQNSSIFVLKF